MGFLDKMKDKQSAALERQSDKRSDKFDKKHRADFESDLLPGESILCFTDHVSSERDGKTYHGWLVGTNQRLMYRAKFATKSLVELHPFGAATSMIGDPLLSSRWSAELTCFVSPDPFHQLCQRFKPE